MMKPENEGMRYYWFNNEEFTATWFHNQLEFMNNKDRKNCLRVIENVSE